MGRRRKTETGSKVLMYRRPKFLEVLHSIREDMSREVDYDVDLFAEMVRSGVRPSHGKERVIRGIRTRAAAQHEVKDVLKPKRRRASGR